MSLLQMSFSGAVLILLIIMIRAVAINKLPKRMFLFLWGITMVRLLIPFSIPSPASVYSLINVNTSEETILRNMLPIMPEGQMESMGETGQPESMSGAEQVYVQQPEKQAPYVSVWQVVWCIGAVLCMAFFSIFYLHWLSRFRTARFVHDKNAEQWIEEHRLKRPISIRQSDRINAPLTYGIFHPVILMPEDTDWEDIQQLKYILEHEYVHICHFDTVTKLICALAVCIHWFNPFVWVMYLFFNRDLELACDERVVRQFGVQTRKNYANMLIGMEAKKSGLMPFYNHFSKNAIEERITSIMKIRKTSLFAILITIVLIVGITTACATTATKSEADDEPESVLQDGESGTDDDVTSNPDTNVGSVFEAVLLGEAEFIYVNNGNIETMNITDVPAIFDPDDSYMKIWDFSVVDLDGDGEKEVILFVVGVAGDMGGKMILHQIGNEVYGYMSDNRTLVDLKTDGTFSYSDPTGVIEGGIGTIIDFSERGCTYDKISYGTGTYEGWNTFVVDHQPAAEAEYFDAVSMQNEKPDAEWYDFTEENIHAIFE